MIVDSTSWDPPVTLRPGVCGQGPMGVVDPDGRVHSVDNLYVTGSSVFPTGGHANPTFTVVALALRLADHLRQGLTAPLSVATTPTSVDDGAVPAAPRAQDRNGAPPSPVVPPRVEG